MLVVSPDEPKPCTSLTECPENIGVPAVDLPDCRVSEAEPASSLRMSCGGDESAIKGRFPTLKDCHVTLLRIDEDLVEPHEQNENHTDSIESTNGQSSEPENEANERPPSINSPADTKEVPEPLPPIVVICPKPIGDVPRNQVTAVIVSNELYANPSTEPDISAMPIDEKKSRRFSCTECPKSFEHLQSLLIHLGRQHKINEKARKKSLKCEICSLVFSNEAGYQAHVKNHTEETTRSSPTDDVDVPHYEDRSDYQTPNTTRSLADFIQSCTVGHQEYGSQVDKCPPLLPTAPGFPNDTTENVVETKREPVILHHATVQEYKPAYLPHEMGKSPEFPGYVRATEAVTNTFSQETPVIATTSSAHEKAAEVPVVVFKQEPPFVQDTYGQDYYSEVPEYTQTGYNYQNYQSNETESYATSYTYTPYTNQQYVTTYSEYPQDNAEHPPQIKQEPAEAGYVDVSTFCQQGFQQGYTTSYPDIVPASQDMKAEVVQPPPSEPTLHKCPFCRKVFKMKPRLDLHVSKHSMYAPFKPKKRKPTLASTDDINNPREFACTQCPRSYSRKYHLEVHLREHMAVKPLSCDRCPRTFTHESHRAIHMKSHSAEMSYQCDQCPRKFYRMCHLATHKKMHSAEMAYSCDKCPKTFYRLCHLAMHSKTHSIEKPFKCSKCPLEFSKAKDLSKHMLEHGPVTTDVKPEMDNKQAMADNIVKEVEQQWREAWKEKFGEQAWEHFVGGKTEAGSASMMEQSVTPPNDVNHQAALAQNEMEHSEHNNVACLTE